MTATPVLDRTAVLAVARLELLVAAPDVPADAASDVHLVRELGVDSLALLEFVARLEYRYGLSVPDADWPLLGTLDEVAAYVVERVGRPPRERRSPRSPAWGRSPPSARTSPPPGQRCSAATPRSGAGTTSRRRASPARSPPGSSTTGCGTR